MERPLTPREVQVLALLAEGQNYKEIAMVLGISRHTVKNYVVDLYRKLGAINATHAVNVGYGLGYLPTNNTPQETP